MLAMDLREKKEGHLLTTARSDTKVAVASLTDFAALVVELAVTAVPPFAAVTLGNKRPQSKRGRRLSS